MLAGLLGASTLALVGLAATAGAAAAQQEPAPAAVAVRDNVYTPAQVVVAPGATVTWTWEGDSRHSVTADDRSRFDSHPTCAAEPAPFRENCGGPGTTFSWTAPGPDEVTEPLTVTYRCKLHDMTDGMVGTVVVDPAGPPPSPPPPAASPSPTTTGRSSPTATAAPSRPSPTPQASPRPTRTATPPRRAPGPPAPSPTAPLPTVTGEPDPGDEPAPGDVELEEFVPERGVDDVDGDVVVGAPGGGGGGDRTVLLAVATLAWCATAGAFTTLVLFGPSWG